MQQRLAQAARGKGAFRQETKGTKKVRRKDLPEKFTQREMDLVTAFVDDICSQVGLNTRDGNSEHYRSLAWEGFLEVYRAQPGSFQGDGIQGWSSAAQAIYEKLQEEKRAQDLALYGQISLNRSISAENELPLMELIASRGEEHQNSVCFWDYLERLEERDRDAAFLAYQLMGKETVEEIQNICHWPTDRLYRALTNLRVAMEEYRHI